MTSASKHRHWHNQRRPALFTSELKAVPGTLVFMCEPFDSASATQLALTLTDGVAYVDGHHPVVRAAHDAGAVYVTHAAQWFGQQLVTQAGAAHCQSVWQWLNRAVAHHWRDPDVCLLATPGATGRDLWLRTIAPASQGWRLLDDELQDLLRSTAHQGRIEVMPLPAQLAAAGTDAMPELCEYDLRLAYMAVARGLPAGVPYWRATTAQPTALELRQCGRWWVELTPPAGWQLPGIAPAPHPAGTWHYPTSGTFDAVVDGCELELAAGHGWHVKVQRALLWPDKCDPYRTLFSRLLAILDDSRRHSELTQAMVRSAVRGLALHTIGAMHGAPHRVSKQGSAADVPAHAEQLRIEPDGTARWAELTATAWPETSHPEWTAALWARARYRVMHSPGGGGILHAPPGCVVAVRTDAVYTARQVGWELHDDGAPGRWVFKRHRTGPMPWPRSHSELLKLRQEGA